MLAWLNTAPDKHERDRSTEPNPIRRKKFETDGIELDLPECDAQYLIRHLFKIGPSKEITYTEIESFQFCTGVQLSGWEAEQIHQLSIEYLNQQHESRDPLCPAPYTSVDISPQNRAAVSQQLRMLVESRKLEKR
jgi:hypothetical protein